MDLERERTQLLKRDAEWATLGSRGHETGRILSYWTDDACLSSGHASHQPGGRLHCESTWKQHWRSPAFTSPGTAKATEATLSPDGQLAYLLSTNAVTLPSARENS